MTSSFVERRCARTARRAARAPARCMWSTSSRSRVVAPRRARTRRTRRGRLAVGPTRLRIPAPAPRSSVRSRHAPGLSRRSAIGPMRMRTSRRTGWPTASHMRRTWRLRPSWIVMRSRFGGRQRDLGRRGHAVVELDALAQLAHRRRRRTALDLGQVLLLDAVGRMGEAVGEVAVVGEQQQPLGVRVETADREHPRLGRHEVGDDRAAAAGRRASSRRPGLVQQVVDEPGPHTERGAVDLDEVDEDVDAAPRIATSPLTVTRPSAISSSQ